jgi:hypothetical protein
LARLFTLYTPERKEITVMMFIGVRHNLVLSTVFFLVFTLTVCAVDDNPILYFSFDGGEGDFSRDLSGNGYDGTIHGAGWVEGKYGQALTFDGDSGYVSVPDSKGLDLANQITTMAWVYFNVDPYAITKSRSYILDKDYAYRLWYSPDGEGNSEPDQFFFDVWDWDGVSTKEVTWKENEWYHIASTFDGSEVKIYVNGVLNNRFSVRKQIHTSDYELRVGLGYPREGAGRGFPGKIDDVKIFNKALSPEEIRENMLPYPEYARDVYLAKLNITESKLRELRLDGIDTSLLDKTLSEAKAQFGKNNPQLALELIQDAESKADMSWEIFQSLEDAKVAVKKANEIDCVPLGVNDKINEAITSLGKGDYNGSEILSHDAISLAEKADCGRIAIRDLKALIVNYDGRTVEVSGKIRGIDVSGGGYMFIIDDGTSLIHVAFDGPMKEVNDDNSVVVKGVISKNNETITAKSVEKIEINTSSGTILLLLVIFALMMLIYRVARQRKNRG